jgi:hypothetical protein
VVIGVAENTGNPVIIAAPWIDSFIKFFNPGAVGLPADFYSSDFGFLNFRDIYIQANTFGNPF